MKEVIWRYGCSVALKTIFVAGARGIGMRMVSVLLSEMVRPNVPKTSTSSAYSISQIARRTYSSAVLGPTFDGCSCRWIRSASTCVLAESLYYEEYRSEEYNEQQRGKYASLTESLCHLEPLRAWAVITPHARSHSIVELADHFYHLRRCSEASEHLPKKYAID